MGKTQILHLDQKGISFLGLANPPEQMEWVDGQLVDKTGITVKHSQIQARLARYWGNYVTQSGQGGDVFVELPCGTLKQGRRPDVCYLSAELLQQFGEAAALPQSPPLIAEIASPTDAAEDLFAKGSNLKNIANFRFYISDSQIPKDFLIE